MFEVVLLVVVGEGSEEKWVVHLGNVVHSSCFRDSRHYHKESEYDGNYFSDKKGLRG